MSSYRIPANQPVRPSPLDDKEKVWALKFDDSVEYTTRGAANADPEVWIAFGYDPSEQLEWARTRGMSWEKQVIQVIGSGDTTTIIHDAEDKRKPYRFKEGTKKGQKAEIRRVMEERFQRDNKAPWKVGVDVAYD